MFEEQVRKGEGGERKILAVCVMFTELNDLHGGSHMCKVLTHVDRKNNASDSAIKITLQHV